MALHQAQKSFLEATKDQSDIARLEAELSKLRIQNSDKDLDIMNLQRRKEELKEDREMLNVALDSKQQEVELVSSSKWV